MDIEWISMHIRDIHEYISRATFARDMVPREKTGGGTNYPTQIPGEGVHALDRMTGELQGDPA